MAVTVRGKADKYVKRFVAALQDYVGTHPNAEVELFRANPGSIRVRIIDPDYKGLSDEEREDPVWEYLNQLPEDTVGFLSTLLLITPQEAKKSIANVDFENPIPFPTRLERRSKAR